jgi:pantoate--beta-alanine ligase
MGQKDYQQCMVIKKLISLTQSKIIFHTCATVREADGLAMSSRNRRLNESEREKALGIYQALTYLKKNLSQSNLSDLIAQARNILTDQHFKIDYVEIADTDSLELIHEWNGKQKLVALIAAFQHEVRLIDNEILTS